MFRNIKGQNQVVKLLSSQIANDRTAQAYLFHGGEGVGKYLTALYFGMALNCLSTSEFRPCGICHSCKKFLSYDHSDFIYIFPSTNLQLTTDGEIKSNEGLKLYEGYISNKKLTPWQDFIWGGAVMIRKESIMMLSKRLEMSITEARYRIVIIEEADRMNQETANAFLKKLEEPPDRTVIILITERVSMLLPTIISRCQQVYFRPLSHTAIETILRERFDIDSHSARTAARMSNANAKQAIKLALEDTNTTRDTAFEIFTLAYKHDELGFHNLITKPQSQINAEFVLELIKYISLIVNDICIFQTNSDLITNSDRAEFITTVSQNLPELSEKAADTLVELESLPRMLAVNVNITFILIKIYHLLSDLLSA
ncbi:MAG TPA: AAA family ATPase [Candidatus Cloacimonadota bacterium]|nr:AAA family ATPase [Candidatus Cloacimonadota bacterium]